MDIRAINDRITILKIIIMADIILKFLSRYEKKKKKLIISETLLLIGFFILLLSKDPSKNLKTNFHFQN